jgi:hypothetical protein
MCSRLSNFALRSSLPASIKNLEYLETLYVTVVRIRKLNFLFLATFGMQTFKATFLLN